MCARWGLDWMWESGCRAGWAGCAGDEDGSRQPGLVRAVGAEPGCARQAGFWAVERQSTAQERGGASIRVHSSTFRNSVDSPRRGSLLGPVRPPNARTAAVTRSLFRDRIIKCSIAVGRARGLRRCVAPATRATRLHGVGSRDGPRASDASPVLLSTSYV